VDLPCDITSAYGQRTTCDNGI